MGSISRKRRADRYIQEFEAYHVRRCPIRPGMRLNVVSLNLAQEEGNYEQVKLYVQVEDEQGVRHALDMGPVFDPEYDYGTDLVERVMHQLGIPKRIALSRLRRADLHD
jgi:hypothetical protein